MKKGFWAVVFLAAVLILPNCKSSTSSSTPTTTPTTSSIVVTSSSDMMYIGSSEVFTAIATMSNGNTQAVTSGWGSDNLSVATVEGGTGKVTIVGNGIANIYVDYSGKRGSKAIRGIPKYHGAWDGTYIITSCTTTGDFSLPELGFCSTLHTGAVLPCTFNLTQSRDTVNGTFYLGSIQFPDSSGPVADDGWLTLTGTHSEGTTTINAIWKVQFQPPRSMTGQLGMVWRDSLLSGQGTVYANVNNMVGQGERAIPFGIGMPCPTVQDALRMIGYRRY